MRTVHRVVSTAVAVAAAFPFGIALAPSAAAAATPIKVETAAWFWGSQVGGEAAPGVGYPVGVPYDASGVPRGDLAVAWAGKTTTNASGDREAVPDKETYLAWDVYSTVPEGSTVNSFTFTVFVDPAGKNASSPEVAPPGQTPQGGTPVIIACTPKSGFGEAEGDPFTVKPADDCSEQIFGEYDPVKQSYTFEATVIAQDWVDGKDNFGLALRPRVEETAPFQVVLKGAQFVVAALDFTPPEEEIEEPEIPVDTGSGYVPAPPVDTGSSGYVPAPNPQPQAPPVAPKPSVAPATRRPATNVAARPVSVDSGIGGEFWLAMLAGVMVLGIVSLVLGDPLVPAAASRDDALTRALRQRRAAAPGVRPVPGHVRPRTL